MKICLLSHDNKGSLPRFPVEGGVFFTQFRAIKSSLDISIVKGFCLIERDIFLRGVMIDNRGSQGNFFLFKLSLSQLSLPFSFSLSLFLLHPYLKQVFISLFFKCTKIIPLQRLAVCSEINFNLKPTTCIGGIFKRKRTIRGQTVLLC